jgi:hypothetical protein
MATTAAWDFQRLFYCSKAAKYPRLALHWLYLLDYWGNLEVPKRT